MNELHTRVRESLDTETATEESEVVAMYAEISALKSKLQKIETEARARATDLYEGYGLTVIQGIDGVVTVSKRGGQSRLDTALVRKILTKQQIEQVTITGSPSLVMRFTGRGT